MHCKRFILSFDSWEVFADPAESWRTPGELLLGSARRQGFAQGQEYRNGLASPFPSWVQVVKALNKHGEGRRRLHPTTSATLQPQEGEGMFLQGYSISPGKWVGDSKDAQVPPPLV